MPLFLGYGFKVLNCDPFSLEPNGTRKIDIAFTPDFTLAKIVRTLTLVTSLNIPVNYTLLTTVPASYLVPCSTVIPRPTWEPYLYYLSLPSMCILLVFIIIMVIVEAEHNLKETLVGINRLNQTLQPTLDLRALGAQTRRELHMPKPEDGLKDQGAKDKKEELGVSSSRESERYSAIVPTIGKSKKKNICNKKICDGSLEIECGDEAKKPQKSTSKKENRKNNSLLLIDKQTLTGHSADTQFSDKKVESLKFGR